MDSSLCDLQCINEHVSWIRATVPMTSPAESCAAPTCDPLTGCLGCVRLGAKMHGAVVTHAQVQSSMRSELYSGSKLSNNQMLFNACESDLVRTTHILFPLVKVVEWGLPQG